MRKRTYIHSLLEYEKPDTESHLDSTYLNPEISPSPYTSLRRDRNDKGGGMFIASRDELNIVEIENVGQKCEIKAKLLANDNPNVYLAYYYRPPSSEADDLLKLQHDLDLIKREDTNAELLVAGDFNVPSIDWSNNSIHENPQYGTTINEMMIDIMNSQFLTQTDGKNILDLMFMTAPDLWGTHTQCPA